MGLKKENTGGPASFRVCYRHLRDTALRAARRKGAGLARNDEEARSLTVAALKCTESPRSYYATRLGALVVP